jgi:hypothetical protein
MRSPFTAHQPHLLGTLTARTAGVVLLTPLVLLAGLLAIVVLTVLSVAKRMSRTTIHIRTPAPKPVRRLEPAAADAALGVVSRRAA